MANDRITGAMMELYKVTGLGGTEVETLIALTKDDIEISMNTEVAETTAHNETRTTSKPIIDKLEMSVAGILTTSGAALQTLGVMETGTAPHDVNGFGTTLEGLRIKVYKNKGDVTAATEWLATNVEVLIESISFPQRDFAEWTGRFLVNGLLQHEVGT